MRKLLTVALLATCISSPFGAARAEGPYLELEKFVVNVRDKSRMRFMQVKVQVLASDPVIRGAVETHMPAVRDTLVMLLSEQNAASMRSAAGREEVREAALTAVRKVVGEFISGGADGSGDDAETPSHGIEALYFTDFVIQYSGRPTQSASDHGSTAVTVTRSSESTCHFTSKSYRRTP